ncbi:MAG: hypothetical protein RR922_04475 [Clostridia bacterium]
MMLFMRRRCVIQAMRQIISHADTRILRQMVADISMLETLEDLLDRISPLVNHAYFNSIVSTDILEIYRKYVESKVYAKKLSI